MSKSKSLTAVVCVLAMTMAGGAFARDHQRPVTPDQRNRSEQPPPQAGHSPAADGEHRQVHQQPQFIGRGYLQPYAEWHRGNRLSGQPRKVES